jgi:hypothetical protein
MSDKELVLETIARLPEESSLDQIRDRLNFLAGVRQAQSSLRQGRGVPVAKVKEQLSSWVNEWNSKSSGRRKRSTTSTR